MCEAVAVAAAELVVGGADSAIEKGGNSLRRLQLALLVADGFGTSFDEMSAVLDADYRMTRSVVVLVSTTGFAERLSS